MNKNIATIFVLLLLIFGISYVYAENGNNNNKNCGAIWTTDQSGGVQDKNHYAVGESIYLNANNFDANADCTYQIKRLPHDIVASGAISTDSDGKINAALIYTATQDDLNHEFQVGLTCNSCNQKHDNFRVDIEQIPEFGLITALTAVAGSLILFFVIRKKH